MTAVTKSSRILNAIRELGAPCTVFDIEAVVAEDGLTHRNVLSCISNLLRQGLIRKCGERRYWSADGPGRVVSEYRIARPTDQLLPRERKPNNAVDWPRKRRERLERHAAEMKARNRRRQGRRAA